MTNLLLTFPELLPEDFQPWINADDARRKGLSIDEFAKNQSKLWKEGLKKWGQSGERLKMLKASADLRKKETYVSIGESILGVLLGRRYTRPVSTTMRKYRMGRTATMDVKKAEETVKSLQEEIRVLEDELNKEIKKITDRYDSTTRELKEVIVKPKRYDIKVKTLALKWIPHWQLTYKDYEGNKHTKAISSY